jgi:hypothetical protein
MKCFLISQSHTSIRTLPHHPPQTRLPASRMRPQTQIHRSSSVRSQTAGCPPLKIKYGESQQAVSRRFLTVTRRFTLRVVHVFVMEVALGKGIIPPMVSTHSRIIYHSQNDNRPIKVRNTTHHKKGYLLEDSLFYSWLG